MKYVIPAIAAAAVMALAGCDRPGTTTSSTTVVKEPVVQKEKETTIVQAPAQPETSTTEKSKSTTTSRVDTPVGSVTRTETETSKTTR